MKREFPKCWEYLSAFKGELAKRNIQNRTEDTWYQYGRSQSLTRFNGEPKVIWPTLSIWPKYAFDDQNVVFTGGGNGPYYALRPKPESNISIYYLLALLSHPLVDAMVTRRSSKFQSGFRSHGKQFVEVVPIPKIDINQPADKKRYDLIVRLGDQMVRTNEKFNRVSIPQQRNVLRRQQEILKSKIDQLIDELYKVNDVDREIIISQQRSIPIRPKRSAAT